MKPEELEEWRELISKLTPEQVDELLQAFLDLLQKRRAARSRKERAAQEQGKG